MFAVFLAAALLAGACAQKQETAKAGPAPDPAQLNQRLEKIELHWQILQKDNPPLTDTTNLRINLADAKKAMAEKDYALAANKIMDAENWVNQSSSRYYVIHRENLKAGITKEDPKQLWQSAEDFWAKEAGYFMAGNQEYAGWFGNAGFEQAELAAVAAIASDLEAREKVEYCLRLADREARIGNKGGADGWKEEAAKILEKRIQLLSDQINWCLSGTVPVCDLNNVRASRENYLQAKKILDTSWSEIQDLTGFGNQTFSGRFQLPGLEGRIQAWTNEQENFFFKTSRPLSPGPDFEKLQEQERRKQKELVAKYNQLYCPAGEDLVKFNLGLEKTDTKFEGGTLIFRFRLSNLSPDPIYRPRVRLCGDLVSEEVNLAYDRFPGNFQASFSVVVLAIDYGSSNPGNYAIPPHRLLISFEDSKGKTLRAQAEFNP